MFPYRVKFTESEFDIQNNDLLYKIDQKCQNTFNVLDLGWNSWKKKLYSVFCIISIIHILYFLYFVEFLYILYILYIWYIDLLGVRTIEYLPGVHRRTRTHRTAVHRHTNATQIWPSSPSWCCWSSQRTTCFSLFWSASNSSRTTVLNSANSI